MSMHQEAIAVIGIGCRLPKGIMNKDDLFNFLAQGGDGVSEIPADRWNSKAWEGDVDGYKRITRGRMACLGTRDELYSFDPVEFSISPAEAQNMHPTQRISLEVALETFADAGVRFRGSKTGVFTACNTITTHEDEYVKNEYSGTGGSPFMVANRISFVFDLKGPSLQTDTACSSTSIGLNYAIQSLQNGECDQALVLGVNIVSTPLDSVEFARMNVLGKKGESRPFDNAADGYVRAEGSVGVLVKPLQKALDDGDQIYSVIVGSATNSNGKGTSITMPDAKMQSECIRTAYAMGPFKPADAVYVECHGTGTKVGDPIEANAVGAVFSEGRPKDQPLRIGSVKSNFGHHEWTSGLVSLAKVSLMASRRVLLPTIRHTVPHPKIQWKKYNMQVQTATESFADVITKDGPLVFSMSNYGLGGANTHFVLVAPDEAVFESLCKPKPHPIVSESISGIYFLPVGGLTKQATLAMSEKLKSLDSKNMREIATLLTRTARAFPYRSYAISSSLTSAEFKAISYRDKFAAPTVCFVFCGQGPQHIDMGRGLYAAFPAFRSAITKADDLYKKLSGASFIKNTGLFLPDTKTTLSADGNWPVQNVVMSMVMFQLALFELWKSVGIKYDVVVGHSIGEIAMAYAAGFTSFEGAIKLAIARAEAMTRVDGHGAMAAIGCSESEAHQLIDELFNSLKPASKNLWVAGVNSPSSVTLAGSSDLVDAVVALATKEDIFAKKLRVSSPFHTPMMESVQAVKTRFHSIIKSDTVGKPVARVMSTVTGTWLPQSQYNGDYAWNNMRKPVRFFDAIDRISLEHSDVVFLEVAPHPVLQSYITECTPNANTTASVRRLGKKDGFVHEEQMILETCGKLFAFGCEVLPYGVDVIKTCQSSLPNYPYNKTVYPVKEDGWRKWERLTDPSPPLSAPVFRLGVQTHPWVTGHQVNDAVIFPAVGYLEAVFQNKAVHLKNVKISNALVLPSENQSPMSVGLEITGDSWAFKSCTQNQRDASGKVILDTVHATGHFSMERPSRIPENYKRDLPALMSKGIFSWTKEQVYKAMPNGLKYQYEFSSYVSEVHRFEEDAVLGVLDVSSANLERYEGYSLQVMLLGALDVASGQQKIRKLYLPAEIKNVIRVDNGAPGSKMYDGKKIYVHGRIDYWHWDYFVGTITLLDETGAPFLILDGFRCNALKESRINDIPSKPYTMVWQPKGFAGCPVDLKDFDYPENDWFHVYASALVWDLIDETLKDTSFVPGTTIDRIRFFDWCKRHHRVHRGTKEQGITQEHRDLGQNLKTILKDNKQTAGILFSDTLLDEVYKFINRITKLEETPKSFKAAGKRSVRILEVGAGTGGLTKILHPVLEELHAKGLHIEYVVSDLSVTLAADTARLLGSPFYHSQAFDLTKPLEGQGIQAHSFDMVMACDVLHATPTVADCLATTRSLLVPGGQLLIVELNGDYFERDVNVVHSLDFIFGSFSEWFGFTDNRTHCTLTKAALGFEKYTCAAYDFHYIFSAFAPELSFKPTTVTPVPTSFSKPLILHHHESGVNEAELVQKCLAVNDPSTDTGIEIWLMANDNPAGCSILGLQSSIQAEFNTWIVRSVIFEDHSLSNEAKEAIVHQIRNCSVMELESHLKLTKDGQLMVNRLVACLDQQESTVQASMFEVWKGENGTSRYLEIREMRVPVVGSTDVLVETRAVNLNRTMRSTLAVDAPLTEFSGVVTSVGDSVKSVAVGDRVFGLTPGLEASHFSVPEGCVQKIPDSVDFETASGFGYSVATAYHGLRDLANVRKGQAVLIHFPNEYSALSLAAVDICLRSKCSVFVVTHHAESSSSLVSQFGLGLDSIAHESDWMNQARDWLQKLNLRGFHSVVTVDAEDGVDYGLDMLVIHGRLVDIRQQSDHTYHLEPSSTSSYVPVNVRKLMETNLPEFAEVLKSVSDEAQLTPFRTTPVKSFTFAQYRQAYTAVEKSSALGLVRLTNSSSRQVVARPQQKFASNTRLFCSTKTYLLLGGASELGIDLAKWFLQRGARKVVLTSRRGMSALLHRDKLSLGILESQYKCKIIIAASDATSPEATKKLIDETRSWGEIGGIFMMTLVLRDSSFLNMDQSSFDDVMRPKKLALDNVLANVNPVDLDFLVLFSSIATVTRSTGQANYAAVQWYYNKIAAEIPNCLSICVPAVLDSGSFSRLFTQAEGNVLLKFKQIADNIACTTTGLCSALEDAISRMKQDKIYIFQPLTSWTTLFSTFPEGGEDRFWKHLDAKTGQNSSSGSSASSDRPLLQLLAELLNLDASSVDASASLISYGLDSISASRLSSRINSQFGVAISQFQLLSSTMTMGELEKAVYASSSTAASTAKTGISHTIEPARSLFIDGLGEVYHCSAQQKSSFALHKSLKDKKGDPHMVSEAAIVNVKLDLERVRGSVLAMFERHEGLRTTIVTDETGTPYQRIHTPEYALENWVRVKDLSDLGYDAAVKEARRLLGVIVWNGFNLAESTHEFHVYNVSENAYVFAQVVHHIITDAQSGFSMIADLWNHYLHRPVTTQSTIQYKDYAYWQNRVQMVTVDGVDSLQPQRDFWASTLEGYTDPRSKYGVETKMPESYEAHAMVTTQLGVEYGKALDELSQKLSATRVSLLLAIVAAFMEQVTQENDQILDVWTANRPSEFEGVFGYFSNLVPIRVKVDSTSDLKNFANSVQTSLFDAIENASLPFTEIDKLFSPRRFPKRLICVSVHEGGASYGAEDYDASFTTDLEPVDVVYHATLQVRVSINAKRAVTVAVRANKDTFDAKSADAVGHLLASFIEKTLSEGAIPTTKLKVATQQYLSIKDALTIPATARRHVAPPSASPSTPVHAPIDMLFPTTARGSMDSNRSSRPSRDGKRFSFIQSQLSSFSTIIKKKLNGTNDKIEE
ncbi:hypothetical protein BCR33DRAFT_714146 [Rhizoclosmatium globosum]|uniref:Uncharacterized protein n=1 Tax=Rhizoclosmatium globosum TaxID=329046 RepID=A0A1Y2CQ54_9FUNG|nr:hypothetical protein BCR33DRAFT_714146 [Rhizoclosmatium globosum]|eukprot:ORY49087.1 hypothetical protein BCR33DRAFT_714146 [Rhizoclosmatium globosum]